MPYYVKKRDDGMVSIILADNTDELCLDGDALLRPDQMFFGRLAGELKDGVYDLEGQYLYDWDEDHRRQLT